MLHMFHAKTFQQRKTVGSPWNQKFSIYFVEMNAIVWSLQTTASVLLLLYIDDMMLWCNNIYLKRHQIVALFA